MLLHAFLRLAKPGFNCQAWGTATWIDIELRLASDAIIVHLLIGRSLIGKRAEPILKVISGGLGVLEPRILDFYRAAHSSILAAITPTLTLSSCETLF